MATATASRKKRKSTKPKRDVYALITDRIVSMLEDGVIPWRKPWSGESGAPKNLLSGKNYRGINSLLFHCAGYGSPYWLTFKQAKDKGGSVRKGEKGFPCIFWSFAKKENKDTGETKEYGFLKSYTVFNVEQTEGIEYAKPETFEGSPIAVCESIVKNMPQAPKLIVGAGSRACYSPMQDVVNVPALDRYKITAEYYSTLFHELAHSTGHESRLNRDLDGSFGSDSYAREELIAEMAAAFVCGHCGIENDTVENSASYINGWLDRLKKDSKLVIQAAGKAQKAADWITDRRFVEK